MQASVKPVGVVQTAEGNVVGTFELTREGKPALRFSLTVDPNANQAEIGQALAAKCLQVVAQEPSPAMSVLEQMVAAGSAWTLPA